MTFAIVTFFDEHLTELGELTSCTATEYASRNGYLFKRCVIKSNSVPHVYWSKISILIEELQQADFTLWVDADALIVGKQKLEDIAGKSNLKVSSDVDGICCGVMLLKNCQWTMDLLRAWRFLEEVDEVQLPRYERRRLHDQSTLKCLAANFPKIRAGLEIFPEQLVLNPRTPYQEAPFIMHYWSSSGRLKEIVTKVRSFQKSGWTKEAYLDCPSSWNL